MGFGISESQSAIKSFGIWNAPKENPESKIVLDHLIKGDDPVLTHTVIHLPCLHIQKFCLLPSPLSSSQMLRQYLPIEWCSVVEPHSSDDWVYHLISCDHSNSLHRCCSQVPQQVLGCKIRHNNLFHYLHIILKGICHSSFAVFTWVITG